MRMVLAVLATGFMVTAEAQTLVESDFSGTAPAANTPWTQTSTLHTSIVFQGWTIGPGVTPVATVDISGEMPKDPTPRRTIAA